MEIALRRLVLISFLSLAPGAYAQSSAPITAVIDINTSVTTPIAPNFSGINDSLHTPVEYWDSSTQTIGNARADGRASGRPAKV